MPEAEKSPGVNATTPGAATSASVGDKQGSVVDTSPDAGVSARKTYAGLATIAALTFAVHLLFGVYYITHNADLMHTSSDLKLKDIAYLSTFAT